MYLIGQWRVKLQISDMRIGEIRLRRSTACLLLNTASKLMWWKRNIVRKDGLILQIQKVNQVPFGSRERYRQQKIQEFLLIKKVSQKLQNCLLV
ncbi:hypothetical protein BC2230_30556 [Burkholderia cepacia]